MKPYGIPRKKGVDEPDLYDIHTYARKSSVGGRNRGYHKNKVLKAQTRRRWKRRARRDGRALCDED